MHAGVGGVGRIVMVALVAFATASPVRTQEAPVTATSHYAFHSDPWINLHHFLYQWSRLELGLGEGRLHVPVPESDGPQPAGAAAAAWRSALAFYVESVGARDHFDDGMLEVKAALVELGGDPAGTPPDHIPGISEALATAMPVYLEHWWSAHDEANRAWIAAIEPEVRAHEGRWVETVTRAFGGEWVEGTLRVDVAAYGNWAGGYTSNFPPHTVILSTDERNNTGLYGLELLFHESGHATPLGSPLRATVREVFAEAGVEEPGNLRHLLLFSTAGETTRLIAEERGFPEHVPHMIAGEIVTFGGWAPLWPAVREHWLPVVRGEREPVDALRAIAGALR